MFIGQPFLNLQSLYCLGPGENNRPDPFTVKTRIYLMHETEQSSTLSSQHRRKNIGIKMKVIIIPPMGTIDNLQYWWNEPDHPIDLRQASWFRFSHCTRTPLSWMEELEKGAISLAESTTKPIWICSSGGVDSETLCEVFLKLGLPFNVLTD